VFVLFIRADGVERADAEDANDGAEDVWLFEVNVD
jgi:hypothetical protein